MALTDAQKSSFLFKQAQGVAETSTARDFFEEGKLGRPLVFGDQIWSESALIPTTAPTLTDGQESGVVRKYVDRTMTAVAGVTNSFFLAELIDSIPFNFGDGSYNYVIKKSDNSAIAFGLGDWIVNNAAGTLTFYGTTPSPMPPKITFYKYIGQKGVATSGDVNTQLEAAAGIRNVTNKASRTLVAGDVVRLIGGGQVALAKANAIANCGTKLAYIEETILVDAIGKARLLATGFGVGSSLLEGEAVWLSTTVDGGVQPTAPSTTGECLVFLGDAVSGTEYAWNPSKPIVIA